MEIELGNRPAPFAAWSWARVSTAAARAACTAPPRSSPRSRKIASRPSPMYFRTSPPRRLDRGHKAVEVAVQEFDGLLGRQGGGQASVVPHVGKQDGRAD